MTAGHHLDQSPARDPAARDPAARDTGSAGWVQEALREHDEQERREQHSLLGLPHGQDRPAGSHDERAQQAELQPVRHRSPR